ncbi:fasciclin domain-containing protein [Gemmatimonas sp.]
MFARPVFAPLAAALSTTRRSAAPACRRLAVLGLIAVSAAALTPAVGAAQHAARGPSIPQVAKTAGQFTTLLAAVDAAGLTETLLGRGPFTLFAPTDDAFKRLPNGTVSDLLKPENREKLVTLLTYHVVPGRVTAAQARTLSSAETVANQKVQLRDVDGELRVNNAVVRIADVPASNGIVHVIDRVLMPQSPPCDNTNGSTRRGW